MKNLKKSAVVLCAVFASMQIAMAAEFTNIDTGLGQGLGGAHIDKITGGYEGIDGANTGNVDLNFSGNAHVNWGNLNLNNGETLNFNAVKGANDLTILNTVNGNMSRIYGTINASDGISNLIISNPNGVLFDGAHFTTAGDAMITTKDLSGVRVEDLSKLDINQEKFNQIYSPKDGSLIGIKMVNSDFSIGGEYNIVAPLIYASNSDLTAKTFKFVTSNGQDYLALGNASANAMYPGVELETVNINGDIYIKTPTGSVRTTNGGTINGNVNIDSKGSVALNYKNNNNKLVINGDVNSTTDGQMTFVRNADVKGNLSLTSNDGFVDIGDVHVTGNADLKTLGKNGIHDSKYNNFVHVVGNTSIDGNLNIDSSQNIHIGGYDYDTKQLADGKLTVGGDLTAHAHDGHVMTTIDTSANKISLTSDNLNVLTDGKATLTANEYQFSANGYIGGLGPVDGHTVDEVVVDVMENYQNIPNQEFTRNPGTLNISGGTITAINTPTDANILSKGDLKLTGANAGNVNITAPGKYIEITGENVKADNINVGRETDKLKVDYPSRNYNLNYTNIRDNQQVTIKGDEEITYDLTNGENGYNKGTQIKGENTYLVGPDAPDEPGPGPDPDPTPIPDGNENIKVLRSFENQSVNMNQVYTPVAYAADLDDDQIDTGVRKNVDGSVTVVRAFPMVN